MELITLLVLIIAVEELILFLWMRFVLKGLKFERSITESTAYVGDLIPVTVESFNYKILPIPWIRYTEDIPNHMLIHGPKLDITKTKLNNDLITITSLFSFQKITRRYKIEPTQRGDYFFKDVDLEIGDFFGAHKKRAKIEAQHRLVVYPKVYPLKNLIHLEENPQGEVSVKRWIIPDPMDVVGARRYSGREPFNMIDWKATAKTNDLQVKQYDFHADPAIMILLSLQTNEVEWFERNSVLAEQLIQIAASVIEEAVYNDVAVGLAMTATLSSGLILEPIYPRRHKNQRVVLLDALAKATYYNTKELNYLLKSATRRLQHSQTMVVVSFMVEESVKISMNLHIKEGYKIVLITFESVDLSGLDKRITVHRISKQELDCMTKRA